MEETEQVEFEAALTMLYKKINNLSCTMWGQSSLIESKLRSADNHENDKWKRETKAQIGYGEITKGYMTHIINLLQNITKLIPPKHYCLLKEPVEEYEMSMKSRFLDIGSGFGKPVFHVAMQAGCEAKGIEVVPARVEFAVDFLLSIAESKGQILTQSSKKRALERTNKRSNESSKNEILRKFKAINSSKGKNYKKDSKDKPVKETKAEIINFKKNWYEKVSFERIDATKLTHYANDNNKH